MWEQFYLLTLNNTLQMCCLLKKKKCTKVFYLSKCLNAGTHFKWIIIPKCWIEDLSIFFPPPLMIITQRSTTHPTHTCSEWHIQVQRYGWKALASCFEWTMLWNWHCDRWMSGMFNGGDPSLLSDSLTPEMESDRSSGRTDAERTIQGTGAQMRQ